ncbi:MAG: VTT domain-containing protein [Thermodesulfobacteriota bacterium]
MNDSCKNSHNQRRKRLLFAGLVLLAAAGAVLYRPAGELAWKTTLFLLDKNGARATLLAYQPYSSFYYIGLCALQVVIAPIPGELSGFLGGLVFGWARGFLYSTLGLTLGSLINVTLGRVFERVFLEKILPARLLDAFEAKSRRWGLATVFILFLIPGAPKDILCYLFGLTRLPILSFIVVSTVARLPGTLVLTLQGDKVVEGDWGFFIVLTSVSLALLVPALLFRERIFRRLGIGDPTASGH